MHGGTADQRRLRHSLDRVVILPSFKRLRGVKPLTGGRIRWVDGQDERIETLGGALTPASGQVELIGATNLLLRSANVNRTGDARDTQEICVTFPVKPSHRQTMCSRPKLFDFSGCVASHFPTRFRPFPSDSGCSSTGRLIPSFQYERQGTSL